MERASTGQPVQPSDWMLMNATCDVSAVTAGGE